MSCTYHYYYLAGMERTTQSSTSANTSTANDMKSVKVHAVT